MVFSIRKDSFFLVLDNSSDSTPFVLRPEGDTKAVPAQSGSADSGSSAQAESEADLVTAGPVATQENGVASAASSEIPGSFTEAGTAGPVLTTAETIAAELAAADAARPAVSLTTFAPENLQPGQTLLQRRRRPGASIKAFSNMAAELFKS